MVEFSARMMQKHGYPLTHLNLGGGFGIRYLESDDECRLDDVLPKIIGEVDRLTEEHHLPLEHLYIEPGRSIVGKAGFTVYEAGITKNTYGGKKYLFVNGGMTDNIRPALYQARYTVSIANRMNGEASVKADIVGKCCESGDIIAKDIMIPETKKGDPVCVFCTGAYCNSMSSNYNGALKLPVLFVRNDKINVASRRETLDDSMKLF
jgi:diaminopimelate decarboxylase